MWRDRDSSVARTARTHEAKESAAFRLLFDILRFMRRDRRHPGSHSGKRRDKIDGGRTEAQGGKKWRRKTSLSPCILIPTV